MPIEQCGPEVAECFETGLLPSETYFLFMIARIYSSLHKKDKARGPVRRKVYSSEAMKQKAKDSAKAVALSGKAVANPCNKVSNVTAESSFMDQKDRSKLHQKIQPEVALSISSSLPPF
jgi:hypothetical protein